MTGNPATQPPVQHPSQVLFSSEKALPVIPPCEHFAGSEKLIRKALAMQDRLSGAFDITADCEDGARTGEESAHMRMVAGLVAGADNPRAMVGVRIHDHQHPHWRTDVDLLVPEAGEKVAYITIPKPTCAAQAAEMIDYINETCARHGVKREIPIHVLIETQGALKEVWQIAALPGLQVLDFGLMDFVSDHMGAIPAQHMRSPGQFENRLIARAKTEVAAAALAHGVVPAHNVTLDLKNPYQTHADASRARQEFGFLRMWSIHPSQVQPIVEAMSPDFSYLPRASAILIKAQDAHWGPIQHEGELHDRATYRDCWNLLQQARVCGMEIDAQAARRFF